MENILLIGANGGIGSSIKKTLSSSYNLDSFGSEQLDLSNDNSVKNFILRKKQKYNHVIFSAGINNLIPYEKISKKSLIHTLEVNIINFLLLLPPLIKYNLDRSNSSIILISSLYSFFGRKNRLPYVISKHALNGACKTLAIELGKKNIRVNSISPGFIKTKLTEKNLSNKEVINIRKKIPLGDLGKPEDIANLTSFLISKKGKYINGTHIVVDGGYSCGAFMGV